MRQIEIDKQPAVMLDLHGYVNGTLIEPTTPPHGENYEYDLFLKNTYANALGMEAAVNGLGYTASGTASSPPRSRSGTRRRAGTTGRRSSPRSTRPSTARSPRTPSRSR